MDMSNLTNLLEDLDDAIDELEENLHPLITHALTEEVSKLPLLDKAQLYILVTYAIDSILFSYLRLNGINPKEHAVSTEIARVRQYFDKIRNVEIVGSKRENMSLNRLAAGRVIKHALWAFEIVTYPPNLKLLFLGGNQQHDHQKRTQRALTPDRAQAEQDRIETSATGSSQYTEDEGWPSESKGKRKRSSVDTSTNANLPPDEGIDEMRTVPTTRGASGELSSPTSDLKHDEGAAESKRQKLNGHLPHFVSKQDAAPT